MIDLRSKNEKTARKWNRGWIVKGAVVLVLCLIAGGGAVASGRILQDRLSPTAAASTPGATSPAVLASSPQPTLAPTLIPTFAPTIPHTLPPTLTPSITPTEQPFSMPSIRINRENAGQITELLLLKGSQSYDPQAEIFSFLPGDKTLFVGSIQKLSYWDIFSQTRIREEEFDTEACWGISPDGRMVVTQPNDNLAILRLRDAGTLEIFQTLTLDQFDTPSEIAFSQDGKHLAAFLSNTGIVLWDVESGGRGLNVTGEDDLATLSENGGKVMLAYSPDGKILAAGSEWGVVFLWNTNTGRKMRIIPRDDYAQMWDMVFLKDGKTLATALAIHDPKLERPAFSIRILDIATGTSRSSLETDMQIHSLILSPSGDLLASGDLMGRIFLWNTTTWEALFSPEQWDYETYTFAFSHDQTLLAFETRERDIHIWGVAP